MRCCRFRRLSGASEQWRGALLVLGAIQDLDRCEVVEAGEWADWLDEFVAGGGGEGWGKGGR